MKLEKWLFKKLTERCNAMKLVIFINKWFRLTLICIRKFILQSIYKYFLSLLVMIIWRLSFPIRMTVSLQICRLTFYLILVFYILSIYIDGGRLGHLGCLGQQQPDTLPHQLALVWGLCNGQKASYTFKRSRRPQYYKYLKFKSSCSQGLWHIFCLN
jgi:hypothetical protein